MKDCLLCGYRVELKEPPNADWRWDTGTQYVNYKPYQTTDQANYTNDITTEAPQIYRPTVTDGSFEKRSY